MKSPELLFQTLIGNSKTRLMLISLSVTLKFQTLIGNSKTQPEVEAFFSALKMFQTLIGNSKTPTGMWSSITVFGMVSNPHR